MIVLSKNGSVLAAGAKNRAEQSKLEAELEKIERDKQNDLRFFKIEKERFKSKYSKSTNALSEMVMYEGHNSWLYRTKSKDQRSIRSTSTTNPLQFKLIHSLIFTNGEVDIEKILCLHLLTAHRTETLTPPKKKGRYMCKELSSTERLIERSKRGFTNFERLTKLLPLFTIELIEKDTMTEPLINDGRLAARILLNEKLMELTNAVATALERSNFIKFTQLLILGTDPAAIRKMLCTKRIAEFFDSLSDLPLINSCESFVLTPPFKIKTLQLDIKTKFGNLENIVTHFRQNVLQQSPRIIPQTLTIKRKSELTTKSSTSVFRYRRRMQQKSDVFAGSSKMSAKMEVKRDSTRGSLEYDRPLRKYVRTDFIAKNKEAAGKTKRIEYDTEEDEYFVPVKRSSTSSGAIKRKSLDTTKAVKSVPLAAVLEKESIEEKLVEAVDSNKSNEPQSESPITEEKQEKKKRSFHIHEPKHNVLKQSTCPACMQKWKTPLPSPKTPRVKKSDVLPEEYSNSLKTNSHHRISMMINKALYKLQSYDRRFSSENENVIKAMKAKELQDEALDNVYLNPMDLAKIQQEIREKETKKKLEKFLKKDV